MATSDGQAAGMDTCTGKVVKRNTERERVRKVFRIRWWLWEKKKF